MTNGVQLLAYADRFGGGGLQGLRDLLTGPFDGLFSGIHILPFYDPIDGADSGFDPIDHLSVDDRLGDWSDIKDLTQVVDVTADLVVNHISADSRQFLDYVQNGGASEYAGMFLTVDKVFADGANDTDIAKIYRPRPSDPYVVKLLGDGSEEKLWTTFTPQQIDLDVRDPGAQAYLQRILDRLAENGVSTVRLDAVGYAVKTAGTSSFMTRETFAFIDRLAGWTRDRRLQSLAEIHAHYRYQIEAAQHVDYVYDFALPPLILHTLFDRDVRALKNWFSMCPHNAITVLDTHDGIGVMDIGADALDSRSGGLVAPTFIDAIVEKIHANTGGVSKIASQQGVGNLDLYQVNCTYYDALGRDDRDYLLARLVQFFAPGCPQVYYVGLLAGENDSDLLARSRVGRDVNRHFYSMNEITQQLERPVVQALMGLIRFRNRSRAFTGTFEVLESPDHVLHIRRSDGDSCAELRIDVESRQFAVEHLEGGDRQRYSDFFDFGQN
ncbi:MAG: sucrose phosphorylase [Pseudomonadota bacterium]